MDESFTFYARPGKTFHFKLVKAVIENKISYLSTTANLTKNHFLVSNNDTYCEIEKVNNLEFLEGEWKLYKVDWPEAWQARKQNLEDTFKCKLTSTDSRSCLPSPPPTDTSEEDSYNSSQCSDVDNEGTIHPQVIERVIEKSIFQLLITSRKPHPKVFFLLLNRFYYTCKKILLSNYER